MSILGDELETDPLSRGYSTMTDQEAADDLNSLYRPLVVDFVDGGAILNATDDGEYSALTAEQQSQWLSLCGVGQISVGSGIAKAMEASLFGPGTTTRTNLVALKTTLISRAAELGLGHILAGQVQEARA